MWPTEPERYYGVVKSYSAGGYGFIHCEKLKRQYERDVFVNAAEMPRDIFVGAAVAFTIGLDPAGRPQAHSIFVDNASWNAAASSGDWGTGQASQYAEEPAFDSTASWRTQWNEQDLPDDSMYYCGLLKTYSPKDGYGFIQCPELRLAYGRDVYVRASDLPCDITCGAELRFSLALSSQGQPQARAVQVIDTSWSDEQAVETLSPLLCNQFDDFAGARWGETDGISEQAGLTARKGFARVVSWNILAPAYATCAIFPDTNPAALRWSRRSAQIRAVLQRLQADVICLQEAEVDRPMHELGLLPESFGSVYVRRPGAKTDGCIIAWRRERIRCLQWTSLSFDDYLALDEPDARYRTGHCALWVELQPIKLDDCSFAQSLVVVTTHLAWGEGSEDVRLWQLSILLRELHGLGAQSRAVLCGDLNSVASGEVYRQLSGNFVSAYSGLESELTTASNATSNDGAGFAETIDYCWLTQASAAAVRGRLRLPTKAELRQLLGASPWPAPIPTLMSEGLWPSDHLPVGVDISIA